MARSVIKRVMSLIQEQDPDIRNFLVSVLQVEQACLANADKGIADKLHNELAKAMTPSK